jgi:UTP--glucose-1-phosphate uridylyltransferase
MSISKAVITAAAPNQRSLPLQSLVDQQGVNKTALQLIVEEAVSAGAEEISIIVCPGDADDYEAAAGEHAGRLTFIEQDQPRGYGDALLRAKDFVGDEPFLHLISDHIYISQSNVRCAKQVVDLAQQQDCVVSAVQSTREHLLTYFGAVGGQREINREDLYRITSVIEKPTPTRAEQDLIVAGLRASHYLCLSGIHVLTPNIMKPLADDLQTAPAGTNINLSSALNALAGLEKCLALEIAGRRYNIGVKYGLLRSQLALALSGQDRDSILSELLELVATANSAPAGERA